VPTPVVPATVADVPALARVLGKTFHDDPMVTWPLFISDGTIDHIELMFLWLDTPVAGQGWMWRTEDDSGAMVLIPPGQDERLWDIDRAMRPRIDAITPDHGARYAAFWEWIASCFPDEPHWFVDQLAVDPPRQGQGIGGSLLRFALERAAADRLPVCLETGRERNLDYYARFGFELFHDEDAPDGGPNIWFMRRDP
jgi:GNAT superfamily N-acetyltransferase